MDKIQGLLDDILADVSSLGQNSGLLQDLDSWNTALSSASATIASNVVLPIALVILALFWMLELYNTFMRASTMGGGNTYMMYTIVISLVKMFLCLWAVQNATTILNGIFGISSEISKGISNVVGSGQVSVSFDTSTIDDLNDMNWFTRLFSVTLPLSLISFLVNIVSIVVNTIVAARFIELYIYNAFAAIPLTTLCYQELHGVGIGFLKNYAGVALQGCVIYLVLGFYPALVSNLAVSGDIPAQAWGMLAQSVILLVAILMSGKFAKSLVAAM